jgi:hypothetical protein
MDPDAEDMMETRWCTELLRENIYGTDGEEDGREVVEERGERVRDRVQNLRKLLCDHRRYNLSYSTGFAAARLNHEIVTFTRDRLGARVWWRMQDIYSSADLDMCQHFGNKAPSKWAQGCAPEWDRHLDKLTLAGHLRRGRPQKVRDGQLAMENIAPWPTVSSIGLVAMISALAGGSRNEGGLQGDRNRGHASQVLRALLHACTGEPWTLNIFRDGPVRYDPPFFARRLAAGHD